MNRKIIISTLFSLLLTSCGGGGGGSAPVAPVYPSVSFNSGLSVNGGDEITVSPTINDPQARIQTREWELSVSGGKEFNYQSTNTSVSFTAPKNQSDQIVTINFSYTYRGEIPAGGTTASTGTGSASGEVTMKAVIPDIPEDFSGNGLSQSADFAWNFSTGASLYNLYYSSSSNVTKQDEFIEINGENTGSAFIVRIPNNTTEYWAISAENSAGESELSSSITISTESPKAEFTNQPNISDFNLVKMDEWGNELDESISSWSCTRDKVTGLIWEVKKDANRTFGDDGLRDLDDKYSYYDSSNVVNGSNDFGDKNVSGTDCYFAIEGIDYNCNTEDFFKSLNSKPPGEHFCGRTDWRLPTVTEIIQLLDLNESSPNFPDNYFDGSNNINGEEETYWTSEQVDEEAPSDQFVVTFNRDDGITEYKSKTGELSIVSVSGVDEVMNDNVDFIVECSEWSEGGWRAYEYLIEDAEEFAIDKANQTGEDWRLSTIKELTHFIGDIPKDSNILTSSLTPSSQVYDNWAIKVIESPDYNETKGQIKIRDSLYGTYHICLSKF